MTHSYLAARAPGFAGAARDIPHTQIGREGLARQFPGFNLWLFGTMDTGVGADSLTDVIGGKVLAPFGTVPTYGTNSLTTVNAGAHGVKCADAAVGDAVNMTHIGCVMRPASMTGVAAVAQYWSSLTNTAGDGGEGCGFVLSSSEHSFQAYTRNFFQVAKLPPSGAFYTGIALGAPFIYVESTERLFGATAIGESRDQRTMLIMEADKTIHWMIDQSGLSPYGKTPRAAASGISFGSTDLTTGNFNRSVTGYGGGVAQRSCDLTEMKALATNLWHVMDERGVWP